MIRTFFLLFQLLVSGICGAQETNQKIGSERGEGKTDADKERAPGYEEEPHQAG
ncbi:MAG: hypothetical protein IPI66_14290 [Chitinophagaceae bacterium]|nr:hypothetical protein [Chitinophagaceae bacterium]